MNPTLNRTEWVARQGWDDSTERDAHAGFGGQQTDNGAFVVKRDPTDGVVSVLNRMYEFRGGLTVEGFLQEHLRQERYLAGVLVQAHGALREHFGYGATLILEVVIDPEFPADQQLFVIARTKLPKKIARQLLSIIERGWWRSVPLAIRQKVELDIE